MKRKVAAAFLAAGAVLAFSGCSQPKGLENHEPVVTEAVTTAEVSGESAGETTETVETAVPESPAATEAVAETADGGFQLADAKVIFAETHPDADITVSKQEGDVYYIEGWSGNIVYKMKFTTADGTVVLDKTIQTGRQ